MKDPYVYEGTNVLINLANIKEQDKLDKIGEPNASKPEDLIIN